jgi:hypothetical protein
VPSYLVLANETIGGAKLLETVRQLAAGGDATFHVVVPLTRPRHGNVIYDDAVRDGAQVRVDLALAFMREEGIEGTGEVGDADPFNAVLDVMGERHIDELIVSTLPASASGWLRRDLIERLEEATGKPVHHIVQDIGGAEQLPFEVTLVLANQTAAGPELERKLEQLAEERPHRFIVVVPQDSGDGTAVRAARERLSRLLDDLSSEHIVAAGHIGHPDPFTAAMNAVRYFHISEIVISTLPETRSQWVAEKLIERVQNATGKPVIHVAAQEQPAEAGAEA